MLFNTAEYFWFATITVAVYYAIPGRFTAWRTGFLLVASYSFYLSWELWYVFLIVPVTLVNYVAGLAMAGAGARRRRAVLAVASTLSLGVLGVFKYTDFALGTVAAVAAWLGVPVAFPRVIEALPVGISFFTFQAMSYSIDVYRGHITPERNVARFALYVAFFPQLVAGPIEKAHNLLTQLRVVLAEARPVTPLAAVEQIAFGLFKKVAIADNIGPLVAPVFADPGAYSGADVALASVLFSIQIYCDFSGYTDIAIGTAKLFGIRLGENFDFPYFARNITDFWRRWHISLSSWLREYLYVSLGGNRHGVPRMYMALALTMLLGGLWHGPSWNFVAWGACHGLYLIVHKATLRALAPPRGITGVLVRTVTTPCTFAVVTLTWIPFVCVDFGDTVSALRQLVTWADGDQAMARAPLATLIIVCAVLLAADLVRAGYRRALADGRPAWPAVATWMPVAAVPVWLHLTSVFAANEPQKFIYFAF